MTFGERLRESREKRRLTRRVLGDRVGVGENAIYNYENNLSKPSFNHLIKLRDILNVSLDYLVGISDEESLNISDLTEDQRILIHEMINLCKENNSLKNTHPTK